MRTFSNLVALLITLFVNYSFAQTNEVNFEKLSTLNLDKASEQVQFQNLLSDKSIVLLGEQTHGDGATFTKKVELIKQLHRDLGFSVVVFESGLYDCFKAAELNATGVNKNYFKRTIFPFWSDTEAFHELLKYVEATQKTDRPLRITGFDNQEGELFQEYFFEDLRQLLSQNNIDISSEKLSFVEEVFFNGSPDLLLDTENNERFFTTTDRIKEALERSTSLGKLKSSILRQSFYGYLQGIKSDLARLRGEKIYVQNPRDKSMAENLLFLHRLYPNEKFIGWGASYHLANDLSNYQNTDLTTSYLNDLSEKTEQTDSVTLDDLIFGAVPMGQYLKDSLGDAVYSIAFTSAEGKFRDITDGQILDIPTPPKESFEQYQATKEQVYSFTELSSGQSPFYASVLGNIPIQLPWQEAFDGIIFIREGFPPQEVTYEEAQIESSATSDEASNVFIEGTIQDEQGNPLPYAQISLKGAFEGTVSNAEGYFSFKTKTSKDTLAISFIGYKTEYRLLRASEGQKITVQLQPKARRLDAVTIYGEGLDAVKIVKKARARIEQNYYQNPYNQELFYRISKYENDSLYFLEESSSLIYDPLGYKPMALPYNDLFGELLQFRNTTENATKQKWEGVGSLWLVFTHDLILAKNNVLHRTSAYDLELTDILEQDGEEIYEISFTCKRPNVHTTGFGYPSPEASQGKLLIHGKSYAVLSYEHCIQRKDSSPKRSKYDYKDYKIKLLQRYKQHQGYYFLDYSKQTTNYKLYDRQTGELTYTVEMDHDLLSTKVSFGETLKVLKRPLLKLKQGKGIETDDKFWKEHNFSLPDVSRKIECE